jgi:hypothetical protein
MGKFWLKTVDPARQCCPCEGKVSPCDTCCSFDITEYEGTQSNKDAATSLFSKKALECKIYFPDESIKLLSEINENNGVSSLGFETDIDQKIYINSDLINLLNVENYFKSTNGSIVLQTESEIIGSTKVPAEKEDLCSANQVIFKLNPKIDYTLSLETKAIKDGNFVVSDSLLEEVDKPEENIVTFNTEKDFSVIDEQIKVTSDLCCSGNRMRVNQLIKGVNSSNYCDKKSAGIYRTFSSIFFSHYAFTPLVFLLHTSFVLLLFFLRSSFSVSSYFRSCSLCSFILHLFRCYSFAILLLFFF